MRVDRSTCPSPDTLERLLAEQLAGQERDSVETHLEVCADCQTRLEDMVAPTRRPAAELRENSEPEPAEEFLSRLRQMVPPGGRTGAGVPGLGREDTAWPAGERLGPYEILGELGNGGVGAVFKARHTELGKVVALKILRDERPDEVTVARFKNEIRAVGRLDHPNIVVAHDAGQSDGVHFLVMEYVDGVDLGRLVERCGRLSVADACEVVRQAAVGLQHAYERGLVHRDVKPSNLMLARDGRVRLLDLGLARSFGESSADTLTAKGMVLGTVDYLAPEQWDHPHAADTRADIYSLGCTLYHLLAGEPPFPSTAYPSVLNKMRAHVRVPPPPITQVCPGVPAGLAAVLGRMLAKHPADRFATPAEVAAALRSFTVGYDLGQLLESAESGSEVTRVPAANVATPAPGAWETDAGRSRRAPPAGRGRTWLIAAACVCLGLIVAAIFGPKVWRSPESPAPPLAVEELRVNHFRGKQAKPLGDLRHSAEEIRVNDSMRVFARLGAPAYCYLIAFNPDGSEQLCHPAWDGDRPQEARAVKPQPVTEFRFFPDDKGVFALDASGLQVFVLVASTRPLPPYAEWRSGAGQIPWKPVSHGGDGRWQFDGREFVRLPLERGKRAEREAEPQVLRGLCAFFRDRPEFEAVQVIAFPVTDEDLNNQWGAQALDLCREGKFALAQEPVRRQIALLKEKRGENHFETGDATRRLKNLEQLAALPEKARAEFVASYQIHDAMARLKKKGKYPDALPLAKQVWEVRRRVLGAEHEVVAVAGSEYAQLLYSSSRYAEAEERFREVLENVQRVAGANHPAVAKVQGDLAMTLSKQGKYTEAGRLYEAALKTKRDLSGEDHPDTAISMNNLAGHFDRLARYRDAEALYRQALDILVRAEGEDSRRVLIARSNLAYNLGQQAKLSEAEALYRETLHARRRLLGEDHPDTGMNYGNLATNLDEQGRHAEAGALHDKALAIIRQALGEEHEMTATCLNNLAMSLHHQRKYEEAEPHFRKALEIHLRLAPTGTSRTAAEVHHNLASNLQGQGKPVAAREQMEKSLEIFRKLLGEEHPDVVQGSVGLASLLNDQKQYAEAELLVRRATELFQKRLGPKHPRTVQAHVSLANNLHNQGKYAEAESLLKASLEAHRQAMGEGHPSTTWAYLNRVSNLWAQGKYREIEELGPTAAASFEAARPRLSSAGLDRAGRAVELTPLLTYLAAAAAGNGHGAAAWKYLESRLARGLLDDLSAQPLTDAERDAERAILRQIDRLDRQIAARMGRKEVTDKVRSEADKLRTQRDAAQTQLAGLRAELTAKYGVAAGKVYGLRRIQEQLPPDAALVAWVDVHGNPKHRDPEGAHWACVVRHRGDPVWVPLTGGPPHPALPPRVGEGWGGGAWRIEDEELTAKVRGILADRGDVSRGTWRDLVRKLYAQRLAPLEGCLGTQDGLPAVRHLIVLPSNRMAGIPVDALTDRFTVSYAPSGTTFAWLQERRGEAAGRDGGTRGNSLLAVGDPIFQRPESDGARSDTLAQRVTSYDRLPATAKEIQAIARVFSRVELLTKSEASEQNLERMAAAGELPKFRFLHFATHGLLDDRRALNSALILAQDRLPDPLAQVLDGKGLSDGRLTAGEILRGWKLDADLVTLSACETALGKFSGGEGYLGFSQALFLVGARSMVLSLWRVDDRAAALLMTRFYENMLGTPEGGVTPLPKARALAEAKRWLRSLSAAEVDRLTADLPKGLPAGTRGVRREAPAATADTPRPFEHPYYWSAFILIGDPW